MSTYTPPVKDASFVLDQLVGLDQLCETLQLDEVNTELATVIIEEAGKLASDVLAPLNRVGDEKGATVADGQVQETAGPPSPAPKPLAGRTCLMSSVPPLMSFGTHQTCRLRSALCSVKVQ